MFHNIKYQTAIAASSGFYFEKDTMNVGVWRGGNETGLVEVIAG